MLLIPAENSRRYITINNGDKKNFVIGSIGVNSYISDMCFKITPGDETVNLCIGNFTSIANGIIGHFNRNHDYKSVSQHFYFSGNPDVDIFNFKDKKIQQKGHIFIGNDCWIGANVTLMSGIRIGNGALIGANSVVAKDVPPYAIVVGNPARVIKYRFDKKQVQKLLEIEWWNWDINKVKKYIEWFKKDINEFIEKFYCSKEQDTEEINYKHNKVRMLFFPDFDEAHSVWKKVLKEYVESFSANSNTTLILRIENDNRFNFKVSLISTELSKYYKSDIPDILVINDKIKNEEILFKNVDYFIASRSLYTARLIEIASKSGATILSGTNIPIFTSELRGINYDK